MNQNTQTINYTDFDLEQYEGYLNKDIEKWKRQKEALDNTINSALEELKQTKKNRFDFFRNKLNDFFYNKNYTHHTLLPPPIEEFLTYNYEYNKVQPAPAYNHIDNLYKQFNLPTEIANMIIYKNKGIMTPTAKIINEIIDFSPIRNMIRVYNGGYWKYKKLFGTKTLFKRHTYSSSCNYSNKVRDMRIAIDTWTKKEWIENLNKEGKTNYKKSWTKSKLYNYYYLGDPGKKFFKT